MDGTDRVVLVAAGFGVWQAGRHLASARWTDVVRVRALGRDAGANDSSVLALELRDGTEILVRETLPGFGPFLDAAETALPGMSRIPALLAGAEQSDVAQSETVLFERYPRPV
ncbi:MAG: hypothetical protein ABI556_12830 [Gemmatimonadales bacterium]